MRVLVIDNTLTQIINQNFLSGLGSALINFGVTSIVNCYNRVYSCFIRSNKGTGVDCDGEAKKGG